MKLKGKTAILTGAGSGKVAVKPVYYEGNQAATGTPAVGVKPEQILPNSKETS